MITTLPATRGPLGATLKTAGMLLSASWLPIAWTRRFAESDIMRSPPREIHAWFPLY
jgi:hypothetical protein